MSCPSERILESAFSHEYQYEFDTAKKLYLEICEHFPTAKAAAIASKRILDMDDLIAEKEIYRRIHINAKRVLTDIGINISESPVLMDLLMDAGAVNFENSEALFIPLKRDYLEHCLEQVPRAMPADPGLNSFGTGATPPFLKRDFDDELRPADKGEFEEIVTAVSQYADTVGIFSLPVATDKSISNYECARLMEKSFGGLKMMASKSMSDDELLFLKGKDHWVDGTSLITSLAPMGTMVEAFLRSARTGTNLLLLDLTIAGSSGPNSPEALLTQIHAQVIFMMVIAQTVNPGIFCMHGGIPGVIEAGGDLSYSSSCQPLINAAMSRVNQWVTGFASAQSGGSTSITEVTPEAIVESELSRNTLRKYGVHVLRHAMGALGSLNFFSLTKFIEDCERERRSAKLFESNRRYQGVIPLYFPDDTHALEGIREIAEKGNPKNADHTLINVDSFMKWEQRISNAARKKLYYPNIDDTVIQKIKKLPKEV
jgi:trimethylamine--corrinoid protein Co-methyltransferase